jgi:dUTP pyrophosphatase
MRVRFQQLDDRAVLPAHAVAGDAGMDLCCLDEFILEPGERALVGTGIAVEIPPQHAGLVLPRSGLALKHGITLANSPGLIDSGYRGELKLILVNTDPSTPFHAAAGTRVAQLVVISFSTVEAEWATELSSTERDQGGFGSTGTS